MSSNQDAAKRADALFRGLFSLLFVVAGLEHLFNTQKVVAKLAHAPLAWLATSLAPPTFLVVAAGVTLFVFGLMMLLGFRTRLAAVVLIAVLVPITVTVQVGSVKTIGPLLKNVALLGGLIHFAFVGSGPVSLDALFARLRGQTLEGDGLTLFGRSAGVGALAAGALALILGIVVASMGCPRAAAAEEGHKACAAPKAGEHHGAADAAPVEKATGVAFLVRDVSTLKASLGTAGQMLHGQGFPVAHAEVVVCGKLVQQLVMGSDLEPAIARASKGGVKVVACGLSLAHLQVDPRSLSTYVTTVPNGLVEMVRLEAQGWQAVSL